MATKIPRGQTPERRAYMKAYAETHTRPDRRAYKAAYDEEHKDRNAAYRAANKERLKARKAEWYAANRERVLARVKNHTAANRDRVLACHAEHYLANTEKIKANVAAYRQANPDKKRHLENKRRARKAGNGGSHTLAQRLEKFAECGNVCFYCKQDRPLTVDHVIPLACGGTDDLDEVFLKINGRIHYLWRAVDQDGDVLDILVQSKRDKRAAKKFFRKLLKKLRYVPRVVITDKLRSYDAAKSEVLPSVEHLQQKYLNNRVENSHQPTRFGSV